MFCCNYFIVWVVIRIADSKFSLTLLYQGSLSRQCIKSPIKKLPEIRGLIGNTYFFHFIFKLIQFYNLMFFMEF